MILTKNLFLSVLVFFIVLIGLTIYAGLKNEREDMFIFVFIESFLIALFFFVYNL